MLSKLRLGVITYGELEAGKAVGSAETAVRSWRHGGSGYDLAMLKIAGVRSAGVALTAIPK
jgi:hypothetical protein